MSDDKNKMSDKASEIARNIWLAGVGAYGRAVDEAQGRLERAGVEPPKLFRDLVQAGAALEDEAQQAMQAGQQARQSVEERIQRVRDNFNLQRPARGEELRALHQKLDELSARVEALRAELQDSGIIAAPQQPARGSGKRKATGSTTTTARSPQAKASTTRKTAKKGTAADTVTAKTRTRAKAKTKSRAQPLTNTKAKTPKARPAAASKTGKPPAGRKASTAGKTAGTRRQTATTRRPAAGGSAR